MDHPILIARVGHQPPHEHAITTTMVLPDGVVWLHPEHRDALAPTCGGCQWQRDVDAL